MAEHRRQLSSSSAGGLGPEAYLCRWAAVPEPESASVLKYWPHLVNKLVADADLCYVKRHQDVNVKYYNLFYCSSRFSFYGQT